MTEPVSEIGPGFDIVVTLGGVVAGSYFINQRSGE
jgi:hypothetical protein